MSSCLGDLPIGTKTDREMKQWVEAEADRLGITRAEFLRRVLELYQESRRENLECPHCGETVIMDVRE